MLLNSSDPLDKPLIYANYLSDENGEDLQTFLESIRMVERLVETKAFVEAGAEIIDIEIPKCK